MLQFGNLIEYTCWVAPHGYRIQNRVVIGRWGRESLLGHRLGRVEGCLVRVRDDEEEPNFLLKNISVGGHRIYVDLANATSDEDLVSFADEWGSLESSVLEEPPIKLMRAAQETFAAVLRGQPDGLRRLAILAGDNPETVDQGFMRLGLLGAIISFDKKRPSLHFQPDDLREFCALQCVLDLMASTKLLTCDECGKFLQRQTDKRAAVFCGNRCKVANWRRRNPDAVENINAQRRAARIKGTKQKRP